MGYAWRVGNGRKIKFWEDEWFGSSSLAIQYWDLYSIINEQGKTIEQAWNGVNLKFTFRRTVDTRLWSQWQEVIEIATDLQLGDEEDTMIWKFNSSGRFSVQSLYDVINDRGQTNLHSCCVEIVCASWTALIANNKTSTTDNFAKRRFVNDKTCLFCAENETIHHLFFECCIAKLSFFLFCYFWETAGV
jgi:hypothetical protein